MAFHRYEILNSTAVDSPALAVYPSLIKANIKQAIQIAGANVLRPHVKTCKTPEVVAMMIAEGITHFKCATIAEAEMLGMQKAKDVLLAYQPVGETWYRLKKLIEVYPETSFSCLVDNTASVRIASQIFSDDGIDVFVDLNLGMNRTGIAPRDAKELALECSVHHNINVKGIHVYDGNIHEPNVHSRRQEADKVFAESLRVKKEMEGLLGKELLFVIGGTPTFPIHAQNKKIQCSPGTFVFWDKGYSVFDDLPFTVAAVLLTRIISIVDERLLCLDMGHKAVASENSLENRLFFLNVDVAEAVAHSEEHLVVKVADTAKHKVGDLWYAVPFHICPTVALYDELAVIQDGYLANKWKVVARNRKLNY